MARSTDRGRSDPALPEGGGRRARMFRLLRRDAGQEAAGIASRRVDVAALALFGLALLLYAPGLGWGVPATTSAWQWHVWGPDEVAPLGPSAELYSVLVRRGPPFNPKYPLFHYLLSALVQGPYFLILYLTGGLKSPTPDYPFGLTDPASAIATSTVLIRSLSTLMAAGIVVLALRTGTFLRDRTTGLVAATLVLLCYPMFYFARTSNVDVPALFWIALGLMLYAKYLKTGLTGKRAAMLGAVIALATATKDASWAPLVFAAVVLLVCEWRRGSGAGRRVLGLAVAGLGSLVGVYLLASGVLLHPGRYWDHVVYILYGTSAPDSPYYFTTPATLSGYLGLLTKTGRHIVESTGAVTALLVLAGVVLTVARPGRLRLFALPAIATIAVVIIPVRFVLLRFTLPVTYILTFLAAAAVAEGLGSGRRWLRRATGATLAAACLLSLVRAADLTVQMFRDSRDEATAWLQQRLAPGEPVGYIGPNNAMPRLDPTHEERSLLDDVPDPELRFIIVPLLMYRNHDLVAKEADRLPPSRAIHDGLPGYHRAITIEPRTLFRTRPILPVNPLIVIFEKDAVEGA